MVVYFHGAPGAPEECSIFAPHGKDHGLTFICFDRFCIDPSISGESYYRLLAKEISDQADGKPVNIVGFSIGAFIALQTCRYLPNGVKNLHLVSAAAPLEAGDFLDAMAGKKVFQLAKASPVLFILLCYWQRLLARFFPDALFRLLFSSAVGSDKALAADRGFQTSIKQILKSCLIDRVRGYTRDIAAYVRPWHTTLPEISVHLHLWHGENDNWSPRTMAEYLNSAIAGRSHIEILAGLSHYSCLHEAAPKICRQLSQFNLTGEDR